MLLLSLMERQVRVLDDLINDTLLKLKEYDDLPDKTLVARKRKGDYPDYYEQEWNNGEKVLKPLGKNGTKKVNAYKKRRFLREKLKKLEKNKKATERFLSQYTDYSAEAISKSLPKSYQGIPVNTYEQIDTGVTLKVHGHLPESILKDGRFQKIKKWTAEDYKRNPMPLPEDPNIARDGTPMRSKGECMWYDDILYEGLPVRVDPELEIKGKSGQWHKLYPDFQFMCFDGTLILVEHFGGWDDEDYAERNKRKIQEYLDCGFVLGYNLIVTSDNANHRTNELAILDALEIIKKRMFA